METTVIYSISNKITNEIYIGSAIDYRSRWSNHKNLLISNKHYNTKLQNSWNFYGECKFQFEIIEYVSDKKNLIIREQYYLDTMLFASENDNRFYKLGFNILRVAGSSFGYKHTKETIEKISGENNPMYGKSVWNGRQHKEETKELISKAKKGKYEKENNPFYGKKHTDETRLKMSLNHKDVSGINNPMYGKESKNRKVVIQYNKNGEIIQEWSCVREAANSLGILEQNISCCCLGKQKTCGGFIWKYKLRTD